MQILVPQHWTLEVQGSTGVVEGDLYKVEALGCCASVATQKYFSLLTGKLITSSTIALRKIYNAQTRDYIYLGAEANTASQPEKSGGSIATITLGNNRGVTQQFQVNSETLAENDWDINSMEFIYPKDQPQYSTNTTEYITASKNNAKGVGIAIELSCRCEHEPIKISLTMAEDKVDPALSTWNFKQQVSLKQSL